MIGWARGPSPKPVAVRVVSAVGLVVTSHCHVSPTSSSWLALVSPLKFGLALVSDRNVVTPLSGDRSTGTEDRAAGKNLGGVSLPSATVHVIGAPATMLVGFGVTLILVEGARRNVGASAVACTVPSSFCGGGPLGMPSSPALRASTCAVACTRW